MSDVLVQLGTKGADAIIKAAGDALDKAIKEKGPDQAVGFPETNYFLPLINALLKIEVKTLGDCSRVLKEAEKLFIEIKKVLSEAIKCGGSSVDQYVRVSGKPGNYVKYHRVYDRKDEPCYKCKGKVKRISLGGRGTYFCPSCQK